MFYDACVFMDSHQAKSFIIVWRCFEQQLSYADLE